MTKELKKGQIVGDYTFEREEKHLYSLPPTLWFKRDKSVGVIGVEKDLVENLMQAAYERGKRDALKEKIKKMLIKDGDYLVVEDKELAQNIAKCLDESTTRDVLIIFAKGGIKNLSKKDKLELLESLKSNLAQEKA